MTSPASDAPPIPGAAKSDHCDPVDVITAEWLAGLAADLANCDDAEQAIVRAIGSATMCWEHVERAGCFRSERALAIASALHANLKERGAALA